MLTLYSFFKLLRTAFPQFAESDTHGFMQQDAEECWGQIVQTINEKVPGLNADGSENKSLHFVEQYMTTEVLATTKCDDATSEAPTVRVESFNKLRVNIGAGFSTILASEISASLTEKLEKTSTDLGRTAVYTKTSQITKLPKYLSINFVRFQWKAKEKLKAKILKVHHISKVSDLYKP